MSICLRFLNLANNFKPSQSIFFPKFKLSKTPISKQKI